MKHDVLGRGSAYRYRTIVVRVLFRARMRNKTLVSPALILDPRTYRKTDQDHCARGTSRMSDDFEPIFLIRPHDQHYPTFHYFYSKQYLLLLRSGQGKKKKSVKVSFFFENVQFINKYTLAQYSFYHLTCVTKIS